MEIKRLKKEAFLQRNRDKTSYYRKYEDSPNFYKNIGSITAGDTKLTDIETEFPNVVKFLPITNVQIINGSSVDIIFYPNQRSNGFVIPSSTSQVFDRRSLGGGVRSWKITNSSTTTDINDKEVEVNFWREGIAMDRAFQQLHKAFFKFLKVGGV